jgi:hypothetical protein
MAKRKNQLAGKLDSNLESGRPGWRDTIVASTPADLSETQPKKSRMPSRLKPRRKTYYLPPALIERIEYLADEERVGISELVTFLLTTATDLIETGQLEIPTAPAKRKIMR